jgi:hypothetical protein
MAIKKTAMLLKVRFYRSERLNVAQKKNEH